MTRSVSTNVSVLSIGPPEGLSHFGCEGTSTEWQLQRAPERPSERPNLQCGCCRLWEGRPSLDPKLDPVAISTSTNAFPLHFGPPEGPQQAGSEVTGTDLQLQHTSECASKGHIWLGKGQNGQLGKMMFQFDVKEAFIFGPAFDPEELYLRPPVGFE